MCGAFEQHQRGHKWILGATGWRPLSTQTWPPSRPWRSRKRLIVVRFQPVHYGRQAMSFSGRDRRRQREEAPRGAAAGLLAGTLRTSHRRSGRQDDGHMQTFTDRGDV